MALSSSYNPDDGIFFIYNINIHNFEYTHTHRQHIERPKQYPKAFPFPLIKIYVYTMRDAPRTKILLQPLKSGTSTIYIFYMSIVYSIYLYMYIYNLKHEYIMRYKHKHAREKTISFVHYKTSWYVLLFIMNGYVYIEDFFLHFFLIQLLLYALAKSLNKCE